MVDQRIVTEVVGGKLRLPPRADPRLGAGHDPSVVDHDVDLATRGQEPLGETADAFEVGQVEVVGLDTLDALDRLLSGRPSPGGDHDAGSGTRQSAGRLQTKSRVATGDDRGAAGQVDPAQDVVRGAPGTEARSDLVLRCRHDGDARCWTAL